MRHWLIAVVALAACKEEAIGPRAAAPPVASSASVRWVAARAPTDTPLLEAAAHVIASPTGRAVISAPLRARVLGVEVQAGGAIVKNAPLAQVMLPEAATAAGAYLAATQEIDAHERRAVQLEDLRKEGFGRQSDIAGVQLELARLRGARDIAAATLRAAGLEPSSARALVKSGGRTTLRAPIAGTVTAVHAVIGASYPPEQPLIEIAAGSATRVEARLPRPLPESSVVEFIPVAASAVRATFVATAPEREPDGTTRVWFDLATPVPAGASGRLRVTLGGAGAGAVVVPATALLDGGDTTVWKRDGDVPKRVPVRVLATSGADALIEGLAVGDEVAAIASAVEAP